MLTEPIIAAVASFDLIVVGAGIVGLAHALAAARRGLRVVVVERDRHASRASVRIFGFVTVSGQAAGATLERALRSRDVWAEVAPEAGIDILQRGAIVVARRAEAFAVLEEFASGAMGRGCELWTPAMTRQRMPALRAGMRGALASPHELRVEARDALPRLARWLHERHGVAFEWTGGAAIEGCGCDAGGASTPGPSSSRPWSGGGFRAGARRRVGLRHCSCKC